MGNQPIRFQTLSFCSLVLAMVIMMVGCASKDGVTIKELNPKTPGSNVDTRKSFTAHGVLQLDSLGSPVNRMILGVNLKRSSPLLESELLALESVLEKVRSVHFSSLRYVDSEKNEIKSEINRANKQEVRQRFLSLCKTLGVQPVFSLSALNSFSGNASLIKKTPQVSHWEFGSDPERFKATVDASGVQNVNSWIHLLRLAHPHLKLGFPAELGHDGLTPLNKAIKTIKAFDFISLHNGYRPQLSLKNPPNPSKTYWATMAAAESVQHNLNQIKISPLMAKALTDYGAFYSQGVQRTDRLTNTPAGALYVADLLRVLAQRDDILMAHYASLMGPDFLSLLTEKGEERLAFAVFRLYDELLHGVFVPLTIETLDFSSAEVGLVPPFKSLPRVTALATREGPWVRVLLMNKSIKMPADVKLNIGDVKTASTVSFQELSAEGPWSDKPWFSASGRLMNSQDSAGELSFRLEPHSLFLLKFAVDLSPINKKS